LSVVSCQLSVVSCQLSDDKSEKTKNIKVRLPA